MIPRFLPPVHSPLSPYAVGRAWWPGSSDVLTRATSLLREKYRSREILLTGSGTSALALGLQAALSRRPDAPRVALPAWACYDLATAVAAAGTTAVLYDLDPATLGPDWDSLERALAVGVAAVVVVHAYGLPVNLPEVTARADRAGAVVIEDAAQAIGATLEHGPPGSYGSMGVLSFGRGKGWTGSGGGALLLNPSAPRDYQLPAIGPEARPAGRLGTAAKLSAQWLLARPALYSLPAALPFLRLGQTIYREPELPSPMSITEAQVLLATAGLQDRESDKRRETAERLRLTIRENQLGSLPEGWTGGQPGWIRLPWLPLEADLPRVGSPQARRLGVMVGYPIPLARLPGFSRRLHPADGHFPGAELLANRLFTLPTHGQLTPEDVDRLVRWVSRR